MGRIDVLALAFVVVVSTGCRRERRAEGVPATLDVALFAEGARPLAGADDEPGIVIHSDDESACMDEQKDEAFAVARGRLSTWLAQHAHLGSAQRWVFEEQRGGALDVRRPDGTLAKAPPSVCCRLVEAPLVTAADVEDAVFEEAELGQEAAIRLTLREGAANRLEQATARATGRRAAIVVDGRLEAAPTIRGAVRSLRIERETPILLVTTLRAPDDLRSLAKRLPHR